MNDAVFSAYQALEARMKMVDIIANNMANVQTSGFKRDFGQVLQETAEDGTALIEVYSKVDLGPGDLVSTGNDMDVAIEGSGYFAVETDNGIRYTRNGSFMVSGDGELVMKDGTRVLDDGDSPIPLGRGRISIQDTGDVLVDGNTVATLKLVDFNDPNFLQKEGLSPPQNLWVVRRPACNQVIENKYLIVLFDGEYSSAHIRRTPTPGARSPRRRPRSPSPTPADTAERSRGSRPAQPPSLRGKP